MTKNNWTANYKTNSEEYQMAQIRDELSNDILAAFQKADRHMQIHANMFGKDQATDIYMRHRLIMGELKQSVMGIVGWPGSKREFYGAGHTLKG